VVNDDDVTRLLQGALHELSDVRGRRVEELYEVERSLGEAVVHGNVYERKQRSEDREHRYVSLHQLDDLIVRIRERLGTADPIDDIPF
jgi:hypothetical protein